MKRTLIQQGRIVTAVDDYVGDVLIEGERITAVGERLSHSEADEVIDARGMFLFPGAIDEHTHMAMPFNGTVTASWETETIAAAVGGTTTIVDFAMQAKGTSLQDTIRKWKGKADGNTAIDYSLHAAITDMQESTLDEIPLIVKQGISTVKLFMAYKGELMVDDTTLLRSLQVARENGVLVMVHAENGDIIDVLQSQLIEGGKMEPKYHAVSRPLSVEAEATGRAIALAKLAGAPLFVVHVSGRDSADCIRRARQSGQPVFGETCPQYLLLDETYLALPDFEGAKYVCSPPLRHVSNQEALWDALFSGTLQTIGTDHCSFNFKVQKHMGRNDFRKIPNGVNGIENWVQLVYTYGVLAGRLSLNRFVDLVSTTPAKLMGLFPHKGTIAVGADADIVIYDPSSEYTISAKNQKQNSDYNMYEGFSVNGRVRYVLSRGKVIAQDREYIGQLTDGRFQMAQPFGTAYDTIVRETIG